MQDLGEAVDKSYIRDMSFNVEIYTRSKHSHYKSTQKIIYDTNGLWKYDTNKMMEMQY